MAVCVVRYRRQTRLANLVGITERETGVRKLGWHGNSTGFDRKKKHFFFLFYATKEKKKDWLTSLETNMFYILNPSKMKIRFLTV